MSFSLSTNFLNEQSREREPLKDCLKQLEEVLKDYSCSVDMGKESIQNNVRIFFGGSCIINTYNKKYVLRESGEYYLAFYRICSNPKIMNKIHFFLIKKNNVEHGKTLRQGWPDCIDLKASIYEKITVDEGRLCCYEIFCKYEIPIVQVTIDKETGNITIIGNGNDVSGEGVAKIIHKKTIPAIQSVQDANKGPGDIVCQLFDIL